MSRRVAVLLSLVLVSCSSRGSDSTTSTSSSLVFSADEQGSTLTAFDPATLKTVATLTGVVDFPHNVHMSPDGKLVFATSTTASKVVVVDVATQRKVGEFAGGAYTAHVFATPDQKLVFATNTNSDDVTVVRYGTWEHVAQISLNPGAPAPDPAHAVKRPHGLAISRDGRRAYVANQGTTDLSVIDIPSLSLVGTVPLCDDAGTCAQPSRAGVQAWVSADGAYVYATTLGDGYVWKVDTAALKTLSGVKVGAKPAQLGISPDGKVIISCDQGTNTATVIDAATFKVAQTIQSGGRWTHGISFSADGKTLFLTNTESNDVTVVSYPDFTPRGRIAVGHGPNGVAASYPWTAVH